MKDKITLIRNVLYLLLVIVVFVFPLELAQSQESPAGSLREPVSVDSSMKSPARNKSKKDKDYSSHQFVVKFKSDGEHALLMDAEMLVRDGKELKNHFVDKSDSIDKLNQKHHIKKIKNFFADEVGYSTDKAKKKQKDFIDKIRAKHSGRTLSASGTVPVPDMTNIYVLDVSEGSDIQAIIKEYQAAPQVEYAQPNYQMIDRAFPQDPPNDTSFNQLWALKNTGQIVEGTSGTPDADMDAPEAWALEGIKLGDGIVVAVVENSGVDYNHPDLVDNIYNNVSDPVGDIPDQCNRIAYPQINPADDDCNGYIDDFRGWDFGMRDNDPMDPDGYGHGTFVAGVIGAVGNNGRGTIGVAPRAKIMPLKFGDDHGNGYSTNGAQAIIYAANNGAKVINNSWGCSARCPSDPLVENAVRVAHALGSVVVWAAGYDDESRYYSPENMKETFVVTASDQFDVIPTRAAYGWSPNYGVRTDVAAPAIKIISTAPGNQYWYWEGTSFAAPQVSGLAALILSNHPNFTYEDVRQVIRASAEDRGGAGFDPYFGFGRINAYEALRINAPLKAQITSPQNHISIPFNDQTLTITGTASGEANFLNYQLFAKSVNDPTWVPVSEPSPIRVENGELARVNVSQVGSGELYILLVLNSVDGKKYQDVIQITRQYEQNIIYVRDAQGNVLSGLPVRACPANDLLCLHPYESQITDNTGRVVFGSIPRGGIFHCLVTLISQGGVNGNPTISINKSNGIQSPANQIITFELEEVNITVLNKASPKLRVGLIDENGFTIGDSDKLYSSNLETYKFFIKPGSVFNITIVTLLNSINIPGHYKSPVNLTLGEINPPTVSILKPTSNQYSRLQTGDISVQASDNNNLALLEIFKDSDVSPVFSFTPYGVSNYLINVNNPAVSFTEGIHTLRAKATDASGNFTISSTVTFKVDTRLPTVGSSLGAAPPAGMVRFNAFTTDPSPGSGIDKIVYGIRQVSFNAASNTMAYLGSLPVTKIVTAASMSFNTSTDVARSWLGTSGVAYLVKAYDLAGNVTASGLYWYDGTTLRNPDVTAPTVPVNVRHTVLSSTSIRLQWNASIDASGNINYEVYRNSVLINTTGRGIIEYTDSNLVSGTQYSYQVLARDMWNNRSAKTTVLAVTTTGTVPKNFKMGDGVHIESAIPVNVYAQASSTATVVGQVPNWTTGTISGGPTSASGKVFWYVSFPAYMSSFEAGWVDQTYLLYGD